MIAENVEEIVLECETTNAAAQRLYSSMGFLRDKLLRRYYFTGTSAYRLKLRVRDAAQEAAAPTAMAPTATAAAGDAS